MTSSTTHSLRFMAGASFVVANGALLDEPFVDLGIVIVTVCVEKGNECDADTFVSRERVMVGAVV